MITKENTPVAEDYGYGSIKRVLITEEEIAQAVKKTGQLISEEYAGKPLLIIGILKGCYVFIADFCRAIKIPCEIAFMAAESYGQSSVSSGDVKITLDLKCDISKYHVIIAEDIVDTGNTLSKYANTEGEKSPFAEGLHPSQQARPQNSGFYAGLFHFHYPRPFCCGIRSRLRRADAQPALHC